MANCEQYGLWVPGTNAVTQCDLAVAISAAHLRTVSGPVRRAHLRQPGVPDHPSAFGGLHVLEQVLSVNRLRRHPGRG